MSYQKCCERHVWKQDADTLWRDTVCENCGIGWAQVHLLGKDFEKAYNNLVGLYNDLVKDNEKLKEMLRREREDSLQAARECYRAHPERVSKVVVQHENFDYPLNIVDHRFMDNGLLVIVRGPFENR